MNNQDQNASDLAEMEAIEHDYLASKAIRLGNVTEEEAEHMSIDELQQLQEPMCAWDFK